MGCKSEDLPLFFGVLGCFEEGGEVLILNGLWADVGVCLVREMRVRLLYPVLLMAVFPLSGAAQALHETDTAGTRATVLDNVEVVARNIPSNMLSGSPVQAMTHADMQRMGVTDISDALKHFSGIQVRDYGGVGGLKTVSIRGLGAQHTGVSYDGVQIGDAQSGQVDISRFTLDNVSLLYLTIGQQDDIFLSARQYASAGTINIETMRPEWDGKASEANAHLKTGSYGMVNPSLLYARRLGKKLTLSAYLSYLHADGAYKFHMMNGNKSIDEKRNNSDIATWRGEFNLAWHITDRQRLVMKAYLFDSKRGLPGGVIYDNTYSAERLTDRNYFVQMAYENDISAKLKLKTAVKYNYSWQRDFDIPASGPTEDRFRQNEVYATTTVMAQPVRHVSVSLAEDFQHNYLSTTLSNCPYPTRNSSFTALAARYKLQNFTATASLLYTHICETVKTGDASKGFHRLSPAFSMLWQPFKENLRLRLSYKDIFRTPTLNDLYYLLIGNTNLRPEKTRQWNIGATWNRRLSTTISYVALTVDGYLGNVTDKIVAVPTMFIWKMMNVGTVHTLGVDVTASTNLQWTADWSTNIVFTYNYMRAEDKTTPNGSTYNHQIAYTPKNAGSAAVMLRCPQEIDLSYNLLYTGTRYTTGYNSRDHHMPAFLDHSISVGKMFRIGRTELTVRASALNLYGRNYEIIRFYPMPGRNYRVSIHYKF
nr:TonB-dependent receptor [Prevotella phocaeensis]